MTESHEIRALGAQEIESFLTEIRLYLEVVEAFRREGHEPSWRRESRETEVLR
jgi:hypothetical protein